jgi:branched-chain amino acid transport system substrate-binding protein
MGDFISLDAKIKDAAKISAKLAHESDTLFVIGHHSTTASADALPNYLNADPPIPVILANETNPELLPADYRINYAPVFRLSPTDNKQAEKAADFLVVQRAKNIWVVQDVVENPVYSRYLVREFISQLHEKSQVHEKHQLYEARQTYVNSHSHKKHLVYKQEASKVYEQEVSKVLLWTENLELPSVDVLQAMRIDWVFFAGASSNCLILTRQVKELWKDKPNKPNVLLSSSCADTNLLQQGGDDIKQAFLTHPMAADVFNKRNFEVLGTRAFLLLRQLIKGADNDFSELARINGGAWYYLHRIAGIHSVADARNALRAFMEKAVNSEKPFYLEDQPYTFNRDGTAREIAFHVWQVQTPSEGYSEIEN